MRMPPLLMAGILGLASCEGYGFTLPGMLGITTPPEPEPGTVEDLADHAEDLGLTDYALAIVLSTVLICVTVLIAGGKIRLPFMKPAAAVES